MDTRVFTAISDRPEVQGQPKRTKRDYNRRPLQRYRDKIADTLGGWRCVICGISEKDVLAFDHKRGSGESERNSMGGQLPTIRYYYHHLGEAKEKLQVLCANCNWKKNVTEKDGVRRSKTTLDEQRSRGQLIEILGGWVCRKCGQTDIDVLTIDHTNGGGTEERRRRGRYLPMISFYLAHPKTARERLQILCRNCNWKKHLAHKTQARG